MTPYYTDETTTLYHGDAEDVLNHLPKASVNMIITSPPYYGLRKYSDDDQEIGLEVTPSAYIKRLVAVFRAAWHVLRADGTLWVVIGDSYASFRDGKFVPQSIANGKQRSMPTIGAANRSAANFRGTPIKHKDLIGIPWMLAFALRADGWYLRSDSIWSKPNPQPESVRDRPTKSHEYIFMLSKSEVYHYNSDAIKEPYTTMTQPDKLTGRNKRSVWTVATQPYTGDHSAVFPPSLITPCILAGAPEGGTVLDPFIGSGTTAYVSQKHGRRCIGIDLSERYLREHTIPRLAQRSLFSTG